MIMSTKKLKNIKKIGLSLFLVLFQAMIFETAFQNLVVLIYVVKTDLFCFMRSAFLLYITLISCHNYLNI